MKKSNERALARNIQAMGKDPALKIGNGFGCGALPFMAKALMAFAFVLASCSASGDDSVISPNYKRDSHGEASSDSSASESSADSLSGKSSSSEALDSLQSAILDTALFNSLNLVEISKASASVGSASYSISDFSITATEITQQVYADVMGYVPVQENDGDLYPVENVNWYEVVLFCNGLSKRMGFDTAYVYDGVGEENYLENLSIDYTAESFRLPTEMEWEVAAHGGTSTTYYWGTAVASKYAYYGQSKGPSEVAQYLPNAFGLFDMAGNVAEWVNDWFASYSSQSMENPTGASTGDYRVVRGGSWSDVVKDIAPDVRDKKDPLYKSHGLGFRVVLSSGF